MKILKKTITVLVTLGGMMASFSYGLAPMSDEGLSEITGQSLFSATYIAPDAAGNPNEGVGFYRVGVEANIAINANIDKLRLGCDGPGGTGACDISIDRLRLSGLGGTDATDSGPPTDFLLDQPFFEFAIKNPTNPATRQVVGMRFGALSALGALTIGENPDPNNPADDTGLNVLSGDLNLNILNAKLTNLYLCTTSLCLAPIGPLTATVDDSFSQQVIAKRLSVLADIGPLTATALGYVTLSNAHLMNTRLNGVHRVDAKDPDTGGPTMDFSLSMQAQDINWQKVSKGDFSGVTASQGWWISIPKVVFQDLLVTDEIRVTVLGALGGVFGERVEIAGVDLGQKPVDNCWGASTFC